MKNVHDLFEDIDRLGEQIAVQIDLLDARRRELDEVVDSQPGTEVLRRISAKIDSTAAGLRELCQALWLKAAGLRRLIAGGEETR